MTTHADSPAAIAALGALAVTAASFVVEVAPGQDVTFPLFTLGGPLLTGAVLATRGLRWRLGAAAWALAALVWLVLDWSINHEDVAFHAVLAVLFAALVALGAAAGRAVRSYTRGSDPARARRLRDDGELPR
jgi:uncharacterized membrane protein AbrB (regulator of aidB expression)